MECLTIVVQYMKLLQSTLTTSQPLLNQEDFNAIFFRFPELSSLHQKFLDKLKSKFDDPPIGEAFLYLVMIVEQALIISISISCHGFSRERENEFPELILRF